MMPWSSTLTRTWRTARSDTTQPRHDLLLIHSYIHSLLLVFLAGCLQTECRRRCTCGQSPNLISETENLWLPTKLKCVMNGLYLYISLLFNTNFLKKGKLSILKHCYQLHNTKPNWTEHICNVKARISAFNYSSHYYLHYLHFNVVTECVCGHFLRTE